MHHHNLEVFKHDHTFGQDMLRPGEIRTRIVVGITLAMMVVEISAGILFGSMALLTDGVHMGSHALALGINLFAYVYARRHAGDRQYSFGTGKVNALGGFFGAVLLIVFALLIGWESFRRLFHPVAIAYNQAILVAIVGLVVNIICTFILGGGEHDHTSPGFRLRARDNDHVHFHDLNLRSAYLHVLADALTSVLAIAALLFARYLQVRWIDPAMGVVGAILVGRWSLDLLRKSSGVLLDQEGPEIIRNRIRECIEGDMDSKVADLHLWAIGPGIYATIISVVASEPLTPEAYKARIPRDLGIAHITVEIYRCPGNLGEKNAFSQKKVRG